MGPVLTFFDGRIKFSTLFSYRVCYSQSFTPQSNILWQGQQPLFDSLCKIYVAYIIRCLTDIINSEPQLAGEFNKISHFHPSIIDAGTAWSLSLERRLVWYVRNVWGLQSHFLLSCQILYLIELESWLQSVISTLV